MENNLIDTVDAPIETTPNNNLIDNNVSQDVSYWLADNVPAQNKEVPEWFNNKKYKTVEQQAKAYKELEKKLGTFQGAPEKYNLEIEGFTPDELYNRVSNVAKDLNMSNDGFKKLFNTYKSYNDEINSTFNATDKAKQITEYNKLGVNASEIIKGVKTWADNNFSENELPLLKQIASTADGIKLLEKLRGLNNESLKQSQPVTPSINNEMSIDVVDNIHVQLEKAIQSERYKTDNSYFNRINELYKKHYGV
jgi:hypothetical protein